MSGEGVDLLAEAERLLERPSTGTVGLWARAAALLGRQALEEALASFWCARSPGIERASMRAQLGCAREWLGRELAGELSWTWCCLSRATHHHPYELDPTREELATLLASARSLRAEMERRAGLEAKLTPR